MSDKIKITQIIPDIWDIEKYTEFACRHFFGFEYDDFFVPDLLDDKDALQERIRLYNGLDRPEEQKRADTLHGAFYDIIPFSADRGIRDHSIYRMQQSVEVAGQLGCRAVIFHTNLTPGLVGDERYRNNWLHSMADTVRLLLKQNSRMEIYCENMFDESPYELADLGAMLSSEGRFGVCLDISHMMLATDRPEQWFKVLSPYIRHFHINDNHLNRDEHLALGDGCIDWDQIAELTKRYGLEYGSVLLEVRGMEKIEKSMEFLENTL